MIKFKTFAERCMENLDYIADDDDFDMKVEIEDQLLEGCRNSNELTNDEMIELIDKALDKGYINEEQYNDIYCDIIDNYYQDFIRELYEDEEKEKYLW